MAEKPVTVVALRLFEQLPEPPIATTRRAMQLLDATREPTTKALNLLQQVGILEEKTGRRRDRGYHCSPTLGLLAEDGQW